MSTPLDTSRSKGRAREASSGPLPGHTATAAGEAVTGCEIGELLHRAAQSDPSAWEQIVRRYTGAVWATVRSFWLQHTDAHDAVQTTWLRLAENSTEFSTPNDSAGG